MSDRMVRISEEVKRELSELIRKDLKDPRLPEVVSITMVKVAKDMKTCKVYVSVLGSEEEKKNAIAALKSAAGYLRREIGRRLIIRATPELFFYLDESIEQGIAMTRKIDQVMREDRLAKGDKENDGGIEETTENTTEETMEETDDA